MPKNYLIIDSSYRDRELYPNPADFSISINNMKTDTLTEGTLFPYMFNDTHPEITHTIAYPVGFYNRLVTTDTSRIFQVEGLNYSLTNTNGIITQEQSLSTFQNAYKGYYLEVINDDLWEIINSGYTPQYALITESEYNENVINLLEGTPNTAFSNYQRLIPQFSDYAFGMQIYLDPRSSDIDNYYVGKQINYNFLNENINATIVAYDGLRRLAYLNQENEDYNTGDSYYITSQGQTLLTLDRDINFLVNPGNIQKEFIYPSRLPINYSSIDPSYDYGSVRQVYRIRKNIPFYSAKMTSSNSDKITIILPASASDQDDFYKNMWVWIHNELRVVETNTISSLGSGWVDYLNPSQSLELYLNVSQAQEINYYVGMKLAIYVEGLWTYNAFTGGLITSSDNNNPMLVTILGGLPINVSNGFTYFILDQNPNLGEYRLITAYDGNTKTLTLNKTLPSEVLEGDTLDILKSNTQQNKIIGNITNLNFQNRCISLDIQSLTLPNKILTVGNRIAFYPYIYIEIRAKNFGTIYPLYSNNPNATYALFKIPMYNVISPNEASFVVLDGRRMIQTVPFNITDELHIRILLPNGEIFKTELNDTQYPEEVNMEVQIGLTLTISF
jgi:hypothetical protein